MRCATKTIAASLLTLALGTTAAHAAVSADQAAKLGKELTPTGAEAKGNADGSIPAWTGGINKPPAGYKVGGFHPDPYADDKPVLTITPANSKDAATAARLTEGQKAMFAKYADFKMIV